jgi:hypothetical protein
MDDTRAKDTTESQETTRDGVFRKDGYNANIDMPIDIEPVPKDAPGAALDIRNDMPGDGIVEIHDDDDEILDSEKDFPVSR